MNVAIEGLLRPAWWKNTAYPFLGDEFADR